MGISLVGKPFLIRNFTYPRAASNRIGIMVGEVPSVAGALPSRAAAFMGGGQRSGMVCGEAMGKGGSPICYPWKRHPGCIPAYARL